MQVEQFEVYAIEGVQLTLLHTTESLQEAKLVGATYVAHSPRAKVVTLNGAGVVVSRQYGVALLSPAQARRRRREGNPVLISVKKGYSPDTGQHILRGYNFRGLQQLAEQVGGRLDMVNHRFAHYRLQLPLVTTPHGVFQYIVPTLHGVFQHIVRHLEATA